MPPQIRPPFSLSYGSGTQPVEISFGGPGGSPYTGSLSASSGTLEYDIQNNFHKLVAGIQKHNYRPIPYYESRESFRRDYSRGDHGVVAAALADLNLVDEEVLSWEQVASFREDEAARANYSRLIHWLDDTMTGKSLEWIQDELGNRLDAYNEALKKHGIETTLGVLSRLVSCNHLLGQAATQVALDKWMNGGWPALAAASGLAVATVSISVAKLLLKKQEIAGAHSTIAFLHDVGRI